jgi:hypothetical protein
LTKISMSSPPCRGIIQLSFNVPFGKESVHEAQAEKCPEKSDHSFLPPDHRGDDPFLQSPGF